MGNLCVFRERCAGRRHPPGDRTESSSSSSKNKFINGVFNVRLGRAWRRQAYNTMGQPASADDKHTRAQRPIISTECGIACGCRCSYQWRQTTIISKTCDRPVFVTDSYCQQIEMMMISATISHPKTQTHRAHNIVLLMLIFHLICFFIRCLLANALGTQWEIWLKHEYRSSTFF